MNKLSILDIVHDTTVDGPGFRTAIYGAGCTHNCPGCHNPQSWNRDSGTLYTTRQLLEIIQQDEFANVTFSGGDPFVQIAGFAELARLIKAETKKDIWCYTGFLYENILKSNEQSQLLPFIDVLVDGRFINALKDEDLQFRGSSNQRIIDIQESIKRSEVVMWGEKPAVELPKYHNEYYPKPKTATVAYWK